ncbi:MAG: YceI family protein, partial [Thermomicrobia bacterium]|nr:YceI family protein [Thermomicrobia bacterium]
MAAPLMTRTVAGQDFPAAGIYQFDVDHARVGFEGRHLMVAKVRGVFTDFSGAIRIADVPEESSAELTIAAASIASGFKDRDDHLRSADFLDVEQHPTITFRSTSLRHHAGERWEAAGDMTIRGITRLVVLDIEFGGIVADPWGNEKIGLTATAQINREEWGLTWNMALE